jgi:hypothetical protein
LTISKRFFANSLQPSQQDFSRILFNHRNKIFREFSSIISIKIFREFSSTIATRFFANSLQSFAPLTKQQILCRCKTSPLLRSQKLQPHHLLKISATIQDKEEVTQIARNEPLLLFATECIFSTLRKPRKA